MIIYTNQKTQILQCLCIPIDNMPDIFGSATNQVTDNTSDSSYVLIEKCTCIAKSSNPQLSSVTILEPPCSFHTTFFSPNHIQPKHYGIVANQCNESYSAEEVIHKEYETTIYRHSHYIHIPGARDETNKIPDLQTLPQEAHQSRRQLYRRLSHLQMDNFAPIQGQVTQVQPKTVNATNRQRTVVSAEDTLRGIGAWAFLVSGVSRTAHHA
jgi:hypothetical protein